MTTTALDPIASTGRSAHTVQRPGGALRATLSLTLTSLLGFVREVAARTEQYWCPIRHARTPKAVHSRYRFFLEYGDAESYRRRLSMTVLS